MPEPHHPPLPSPSPLARHWNLDPAVVFLNHGSFGACPAEVLEHQRRLRDRLEREPVRFFVEDYEPLLDAARADAAAFLGCDADDLAFVHNATMGVNTVLHSLPFRPGDEILTNSQEYNACNNAVARAAERTGAVPVRAELPFPVASPEQVVNAILQRVTPRTRLALVSHVTSPTGLVLPVERLVPELARRGVLTLVDGAHGPGMLPLDLRALGCDFYTGNFHKWVCAPKGAAFLFVRRDHQHLVRPLITSHGANSPRTDRSRFRLESDFLGVLDPTPWMTVPHAIRTVASLAPGGWPEVRRRNRDLALAARDLLCRALGATPPAPDTMLGSLAAVELPDRDPAEGPPGRYPDPLQDRLVARHAVQVPIVNYPAAPRRLVRVSAHLYNSLEQVEYLARALRAELNLH
jgi:isopenicillin-N epimerase